MIIFGVDPGTATTGYGVIKTSGANGKTKFDLITYDCIVTPKEQEMPMRLFSIGQQLKTLLERYKPDCLVIEQLFFGVNSRTAMTVGQARGVVLSTTAGHGIPIHEYQGLQVKLTLTGFGRADKKQIQKAVMDHLGKVELKKPTKGFLDDAADALGVAICHVIRSNNLEMGDRVNILQVDKKPKSKKQKAVGGDWNRKS